MKPLIRSGSLTLMRVVHLLIVGSTLLAATASHGASFSPADVYRSASQSVVFIFGTNAGRTGSSGTGTLISSDGMILTNNHVIANDATDRPYKTLEVYFKPDPTTGDAKQDLRRGMPARVIARDKDLDLAVIQVQSVPSSAAPIVFGRSEQVEVGQQVAAIGHPQGGGLWTLTTGTISSSRTLGAKPVFQSQASLNPGNSGGPLLDASANLIGVNTAIIRSTNSGVATEGLNFSIKSDAAIGWLNGNGIRVQIARIDAAVTPTAKLPSAPEEEPRVAQTTTATPIPEARPEPAHTPEAPTDTEPKELEVPSVLPKSPSPTAPKEPANFEGPNGELMFGIPDDAFDLDSVEQDMLEQIRSKAKKAFEELDEF